MVLIQLLLPTGIPKSGGTPDAMAALGHTRRELAEAFDGLTAYLRSPATGLWTAPDGRQERDDVVMVEVVTDTFDRAWWRRYATRRPNDAQPWSRTNLADWFNRGLHARHLHGCLQRHESVCRFVFLCIESRAERRRRHGDVPHARWRDSTPPAFRFAVKIPRAITHELKLQRAREPFVIFLAQTDGLAEKRGPLLLQPLGGMRNLQLIGRIDRLQFALLQGWLSDSQKHDIWSGVAH